MKITISTESLWEDSHALFEDCTDPVMVVATLGATMEQYITECCLFGTLQPAAFTGAICRLREARDNILAKGLYFTPQKGE